MLRAQVPGEFGSGNASVEALIAKLDHSAHRKRITARIGFCGDYVVRRTLDAEAFGGLAQAKMQNEAWPMSIEEAAQIMELEDVGSLPVVDADGRLLGIVTDRDIAVRAVSRGRDPSTPVGDVASNDVITVTPEDDLDAALDQMARHRVRRLPVVHGDMLVGMLAQADVARNGNDKSVGEVVALISTPNRGPRVEEARPSARNAPAV